MCRFQMQLVSRWYKSCTVHHVFSGTAMEIFMSQLLLYNRELFFIWLENLCVEDGTNRLFYVYVNENCT
jgi:hypothetical protein